MVSPLHVHLNRLTSTVRDIFEQDYFLAYCVIRCAIIVRIDESNYRVFFYELLLLMQHVFQVSGSFVL